VGGCGACRARRGIGGGGRKGSIGAAAPARAPPSPTRREGRPLPARRARRRPARGGRRVRAGGRRAPGGGRRGGRGNGTAATARGSSPRGVASPSTAALAHRHRPPPPAGDPAAPGQSASRTRPIRSVEESGAAPILFTPFFNKGTVFTAAERRLLGIEGLLPPAVETLDAQAARVLAQLRTECAGPLERYSRLSWLASTNVALFYYVLIVRGGVWGWGGAGLGGGGERAARPDPLPFRLLASSLPPPLLAQNNLDELAPVIYTPTVGVACQRFSLHYRHPMGVFCDAIHGRDRFRACLSNWPNHAAQVAVVTDGGRGVEGLGWWRSVCRARRRASSLPLSQARASSASATWASAAWASPSARCSCIVPRVFIPR